MLQALNEALALLGKRYGLTACTLDENHSLGLSLNNGTDCYLSFMPESEKLFFYSPLLHMLPSQAEQQLGLLSALMQRHYLERESGEGTFAIHPEEQKLYFQYGLRLVTPTADQLEEQLADFLGRVQQHTETIESVLNGEKTVTTKKSIPSPQTMGLGLRQFF
ncbi:type III secretion system chaperone [Pokkaliibacter sp. CJK22405]|uniref:type III secretion system chaperone n=1 Tax=Pokkaliibacter sp. CJK22405 TaxID=3384615 RepID=UPI0039850667